MNVLELFAGSRSIGNEAEKLGHNVFSCDIEPFDGINLVQDIITIEREQIPFIPDFIWASPVCSAWSKTGWFHHWDTAVYRRTGLFRAKTQYAETSVQMVRKTIEIFSWYPKAKFFMENPEGMMQCHPVINSFVSLGLHKNLRREKVTYCTYGDNVMKPTHIWTNSKNWIPKKPCNNGDECHARSPRGTQKGIRQKKDSYERSKIPPALCHEVLTHF